MVQLVRYTIQSSAPKQPSIIRDEKKRDRIIITRIIKSGVGEIQYIEYKFLWNI